MIQTWMKRPANATFALMACTQPIPRGALSTAGLLAALEERGISLTRRTLTNYRSGYLADTGRSGALLVEGTDWITIHTKVYYLPSALRKVIAFQEVASAKSGKLKKRKETLRSAAAAPAAKDPLPANAVVQSEFIKITGLTRTTLFNYRHGRTVGDVDYDPIMTEGKDWIERSHRVYYLMPTALETVKQFETGSLTN